MAGPADPREARPEGKLHDPAIQGNEPWRFRLWMGGSRPPMERLNFESMATSAVTP
jgi:hypothetical protein